jgi:hypothetical protein
MKYRLGIAWAALYVAPIILLAPPVAAAPVTSGSYFSSGVGQYGLAVTTSTTLTVPHGTDGAEICVETAGVRYTDDGVTAASSTVGIPVVPTSTTQPACFQYFGPLNKIQFTAISGSPTLDVSYYKTSE